MQWQNVNDVETLKSLLAHQQQQLQALQGQGQQQKAERTFAGKRKAQDPDFVQDFPNDEPNAGTAKDDDDYDPASDSDYDDAPKKKKASNSKKQKGSTGRKKQRRESWDDDSCSDSNADVRGRQQQKQEEKISKAAAVALRSVKSAINQQMVRARVIAAAWGCCLPNSLQI